MNAETIVDAGVLPDWLLRSTVRRVCAARLREQEAGGASAQALRQVELAHQLVASPIAVDTDAAWLVAIATRSA